VTLSEALDLTALIAFKDPRRHGRAGARWITRFLEEKLGLRLFRRRR
jgi:hypothetical protein